MYPAVASRRSAGQKKARQRVDKLRRYITDESLPTGTVVMIKDPRYLLDPSKKPSSEPTYIGHYTVVRRTGHGPYVLSDTTGVRLDRAVPLDQMKVLYKPDEAPAGAEDLDNADVAYEVEEIISHRDQINGQQEFLVKWKNYASEHNSWVKLADFHDHNLVHDYLNKTHGVRRSTRNQAQSSVLTAFIHPSRQEFFNKSGQECIIYF